jgi:hypothetical protein
VTDAQIAEYRRIGVELARRTRREQGLPELVEDMVLLRRGLAILGLDAKRAPEAKTA